MCPEALLQQPRVSCHQLEHKKKRCLWGAMVLCCVEFAGWVGLGWR